MNHETIIQLEKIEKIDLNQKNRFKSIKIDFLTTLPATQSDIHFLIGVRPKLYIMFTIDLKSFTGATTLLLESVLYD